MAFSVIPYISFQNTAREALEFYRSVLGGEVNVMTFGSMPMPGLEEADMDLVMHGSLSLESGQSIYAADTPAHMEYRAGASLSIALVASDPEDLRAQFAGLAEGGTVLQAYETAPWGDTFGMLTDKYGVNWMFNAGQGNQQG